MFKNSQWWNSINHSDMKGEKKKPHFYSIWRELVLSTHTHVTRTSALCWERLGVFKEFTLTSPVFSSFVPSITHSDRPDQSRAERAALQTNLNCIPQTPAQEKQTRHPSLTSWRTRAFSYKCTWAGFSNWEFQCLWLVNRWSVPDMDRHVLYDYTEKQVNRTITADKQRSLELVWKKNILFLWSQRDVLLGS